MATDRIFKNRMGLALGGGGARGIAHVGVLRALEERGVRVSSISGTSVGAFVATLYAFGKSSSEISQIMGAMSFSKVTSFFPNKLGFSSNSGIKQILQEAIGDMDISDALIPMAIVCTDLITGRKVVFTEGPAVTLVRASTCLPGIYTPVSYQGMLLVDGALVENVPVMALKELGAKFIVGVSLAEGEDHNFQPQGITDVMGRCIDILIDSKTEETLSYAHYVVRLDLSFMGRFQSGQAPEAEKLGYEHTVKLLDHSLSYWFFKPILDYVNDVWSSVNGLVKSLVSSSKIAGWVFFARLKVRQIFRRKATMPPQIVAEKEDMIRSAQQDDKGD